MLSVYLPVLNLVRNIMYNFVEVKLRGTWPLYPPKRFYAWQLSYAVMPGNFTHTHLTAATKIVSLKFFDNEYSKLKHLMIFQLFHPFPHVF